MANENVLEVVQEDWDRAIDFYKVMIENNPFYPDLVKEAPWLKLLDKPDWLGSATVCSGVLVNEPPLYEAVALKTGSPWNQRCVISAETGLPIWGDDYYSDMVIWALPMALARQGVRDFVAADGLVGRMIEAARPKRA